MFGYDYFNVGPHFDLNSSLDTISTCIQGVLDDYNSRTITYKQAAARLEESLCGSQSDNEIYDILITENPNAPLHPLTDDNGNDEDDAPNCAYENRHVASFYSSSACGACLSGFSEDEHGNCEEDEEIEIQGDTHVYSSDITRKLLIATVGILGLLVFWKK